MTKPKILLVLDGVAESTFAFEETTLSNIRPHFLNKLTQTLKVGLFDPSSSDTNDINTDFIIATLAGIQLRPWPGRAWLEAAAIGQNKELEYAAIIRTYDSNGERLTLSSKAIDKINNVKYGDFRIFQRLHERTANSWLLLSETEPDLVSIEDFLNCIKGNVNKIDNINVNLNVANIFKSSLNPIVSSRLESTVLAHAEGSILGVCHVGGITGLNRNGSPIDMDLHKTLFSEIRNLLVKGLYQNFILYIKATDWASHLGSRELKTEWLLYIDKELISFLYELRSSMDITIVSDHRTDIGSEKPTQNSSIFATHSKEADNCPFVETEIEKIWKGRPLTLKELSWLIFPT